MKRTHFFRRFLLEDIFNYTKPTWQCYFRLSCLQLRFVFLFGFHWEVGRVCHFQTDFKKSEQQHTLIDNKDRKWIDRKAKCMSISLEQMQQFTIVWLMERLPRTLNRLTEACYIAGKEDMMRKVVLINFWIGCIVQINGEP